MEKFKNNPKFGTFSSTNEINKNTNDITALENGLIARTQLKNGADNLAKLMATKKICAQIVL